jgi:Flp pilus assembly protein TadD
MHALRRIPPHYAVAAVLSAMVIVVYWRVGHFPFIGYDDDRYILNNPALQGGLSLSGLRWAFTTDMDAGRIPLTWLSRMLDISLFGMDAGKHHLVNVLLHLLNTLLLFQVLRKMTGRMWECGLVAAFFAVHPLHVESVAWVTERKDVLAGFFWMLSMWAYARYAERPGVVRYGLVVLFFSLGLMSKAILVTFPFVLLLLDYWPLGRFSFAGELSRENPSRFSHSPPGRLVQEKIPLLFLSLIASVVTYRSQDMAGMVVSLELSPLWVRTGNALQAYASYLGKTVWPSGLAFFYPHPGTRILFWKIAVAGMLLGLVTVFFVRQARNRGWLAVGWFWFLGTLVPVLGLVHVGDQAMADRCTYIPLIGLSIVCAWGSGELAGRWKVSAAAMAAVSGAGLAALMACSWVQVGYWRGSVPLFTHALEVTRDNWGAQNALGKIAAEAGREEEAVARFREAVRLRPDISALHKNLALSLAKVGRLDEAATHLREALRLSPGDGDSAYALYVIRSGQGKKDEALRYFNQGLRAAAASAAWNNDMGLTLAGLGKIDDAIAFFREALRLQPGYAEAHYNLGVALGRLGKRDEAIPHFREALRISPADADAHNKIGVSLVRLERLDEAMVHFREALKMRPDHEDARYNLGVTLERLGKKDAAPPRQEKQLR